MNQCSLESGVAHLSESTDFNLCLFNCSGTDRIKLLLPQLLLDTTYQCLGWSMLEQWFDKH